jgi:hypothetical protein
MITAGSNELGYANTALITALFDVLADKGILTVSDLATIVTDAIDSLEPDRNIISGAITFIEAAIVPQIRKYGAA